MRKHKQAWHRASIHTHHMLNTGVGPAGAQFHVDIRESFKECAGQHLCEHRTGIQGHTNAQEPVHLFHRRRICLHELVTQDHASLMHG